MVKSEMIKRSPLRILEKTTNGGLGQGNVGVIAARKGVGKTAFLVHLAADRLFQGQHVIHVSFSGKTDHIIDWYEDIFSEIASRYKLEGKTQAHQDAIRNRVIMNFNQEGVQVRQVTNSLLAMIEQGNFNADLVVVDGFSFTKATPEQLRTFKEFAERMQVEIWFTASLPEGTTLPASGIVPDFLAPFMEDVSVLAVLRPEGGYLSLELVKAHDHRVEESPHLRLDPKILLICE